MIVILLSILCLAAAKPTSQPGSYETHLTSFKEANGVEGLLYGVPEYEDPEIALFQIAAMGVMPVLTVLQMDEDTENLKEKDATWYEDLGVKESLDRIISKLQMAGIKFEKENSNILLDIEMPLHELMELDQRLHTNAHPDSSSTILKIFSSNRDGPDFKSGMTLTSTEMSIGFESPESLHKWMELDQSLQQMTKDGRPDLITTILKLMSQNRDESDFNSETALTSTEMLISSESPESSHKVIETDQRLHTEAHPDLSESVLEISNSNRDESHSKSETGITSTETPSGSPDFENRFYEKRMKTPLGEALSFTETNKYQDLGKATIGKKWTPKSLNTVEK